MSKKNSNNNKTREKIKIQRIGTNAAFNIASIIKLMYFMEYCSTRTAKYRIHTFAVYTYSS